MFQEKDKLYIEDEDQCSNCMHTLVALNLCPLMEALQAGIVELVEESVITKNCGFFKTGLKVMKGKSK